MVSSTEKTLASVNGWAGIAGIVGGIVLAAFIFPTLAMTFPEVVETYGDGTMMPSVAFAFPATGVFFVVGFLLFGRELYATEAVQKGASLLTMIGTLIFGIGLSGFAPMIVVRLGAVVFGAGLVWLGVSLLRRPSSAATT